jgi:uroporphyrinogen decarboxylase
MNNELTHKERIERTLSGGELDRPAVSVWRHFYHRENSRADLANSMIDFQRKFDWDFMKINPRASYHIEDWGAVVNFSNEPLVKPKVISFPVSSKSDWAKIEPLDRTKGTLGETLGATEDIVKALGSEIHIVQTVFSPLSIAGDLVASDPHFIELLHDGPRELHAALEAITETFISYVRDLMKTGISGIFFATTEWASRSNLTEEEYLEFGRPYDLKVLRAAAPAMFNIVHVCGKYCMLPLFRDYPVPVISWNPFDEGNMSVHQAAQIIDKVFLAGVDHAQALLAGPTTLIRDQIETCLRQAPKGRIIIGPGCAAKVATPDEHLNIVKETVKGWKP